MTFKQQLKKLAACNDAIEWAGDRDARAAWNECERADWMLWLAQRVLDLKLVMRAACACARTALQFVPAGEDRPRVAIETAEVWTRGEATIEAVRIASVAARTAAQAAYYAANAANSYAAYAAHSAAVCAGFSAADHAADADAYADYAAYAERRTQALREMADLVRGIISAEEISDAMKGLQ